MNKHGICCDGCYHALGGVVCSKCEMVGGLPTKYCGDSAPPRPVMPVLNETKPPLGVTPRWMHDSQRVGEVLEALMRYNDAGKPVPQEWLDELNDKIKKEEAK